MKFHILCLASEYSLAPVTFITDNTEMIQTNSEVHAVNTRQT